MLSAARQKLLTEVQAGSPMGELLRRYWYPIAATSELNVGETKKVRLLSQDLVLFRTLAGRLGLLDEHCPHRRVSLVCGAVDEQGIRCPYHGWKFDTEGTCVSIPSDDHKPALLNKARTSSYPVQELAGLIFAYLGPDPVPLLPRYDLYVWDNVLRDIGYAIIPCHWLQIMENSVDPVHVEWLHGHHLAHMRAQSGQSLPTHYQQRHVKIAFDRFPYGIIKRRLLAGGHEDDDDWRVGHPLIFPTMLRVGSQGQHRFQIRVPIDEHQTLHYWYSCYRPPTDRHAPPQQQIPLYEVPWRDQSGRYILDYVDGADIMAWVTQGTITDRTRERLVSSDRGLVLYRKLLLEQIKQVQAGLDPMGVIRRAEDNESINFDQEHNKFRAQADFLRQSIAMSHVRYSPLKDEILTLLSFTPP